MDNAPKMRTAYERINAGDMNMDADDVIAGGDKTVARVTLTGTHRGEFAGMPPPTSASKSG